MTGDSRARSLWRTAELTSFIGREDALDEAQALLNRTRLLTLAGPGGVGKTRLAVELARRTQHDCRMAYLAEVDTPDGLHREVIRAAGIVDQTSKPTTDLLVEHLRDRQQLLILDNCEHLWSDVADLVDLLLTEAPGVRVLATSRRPLDLAGEHVVWVEPLSVRPPDSTAGDVFSEAMTLLLDRTAATGRPVDPNDLKVRQLVEWSGGLPLVLELIAVRIGGGLAPAAILERMDGGRLLTTSTGSRRVLPHHRTLEQTLDWSYGLCSDGERRLWARISVFAGGFTLAAAERVCSDDVHITKTEVVDLLDGLVRQSLVTPTGEGHYQQLQPVREYGRRRLRDFGEESALRAAHRDFFRHSAAESARCCHTREEAERLEQAILDLPNLRAALNHCGATPEDAEIGLAIITDLTRSDFCFYYSLLGEFCDWLERLLALAPDQPTFARINATITLGWIRLNQGDMTRAKAQLDQCQNLAGRAGTPELPGCYFLAGAYRLFKHGDPESIELLGKARKLYEAAGPAFTSDRATSGLLQTVAAVLCGDQARAVALSERTLAEAKAAEAAWTSSWALWATGVVPLRFGDPSLATARFQQALTQQIGMRDKWASLWSMEALSWSLAAEATSGMASDSDRIAEWAAEVQGGAARLRQDTGVSITGLRHFKTHHDTARARLLHILGPDRYTEAFRRGTALDTPSVHALALHPRDGDLPVGRRVTLDGLSERQRQVAELVADGLRNRQIAERLVVSVRTVEHHLGAILAKLGATNRVQLASWVAEQRRAGGH